MSTPIKKARYQEDVRQQALHSPQGSTGTQRSENHRDNDDAMLSPSLIDLFRRRIDAKHRDGSSLEPRNVISSKFPNRFSCQDWFTKSGSVCTLRIETRCDDSENERDDGIENVGNNSDDDRSEGQERILLFRSDHRGAIGKIIFSYHHCWDVGAQRRNGRDDVTKTIHAKIQVVDVKDAYRGFDLGGLLVSLAVEKLGRRLCRCDALRRRDDGTIATDGRCAIDTAGSRGAQSIFIGLDAEEDSRRHNRLVAFYRRLRFDVRKNAKISYLNNNDGETIRKVSMQRLLFKDCCGNEGLLLSLLINDGAAFLPVSFACSDSDRMVCVGSRNPSDRNLENWLLVEKGAHEGMICFISTTGTAMALSDLRSGPGHHGSATLGPLWFHLRHSEATSDDATQFWMLETHKHPNRYLACDPYDRRLVLSLRPILWCCDSEKLQLVCWSDVTSALREQYRRSWAIQTVPFVRRMRDRYLQFNLRPMTLLEAMRLAASVEADPFSKRRDGPSLRRLCLATAELAHRLDEPDWVWIVALVYHLGRLVPTLKDHHGSPNDYYDRDFDWTPAIESRVMGYPAPTSATFYEFYDADEDLEMDECCSEADRRYGDSIGLDQALLTFTGPEYVYHWLRHNQAQLPDEGLSMVRLASLVDWHSRGAYRDLASTSDAQVLPFVVEFHEIVRRARWETASLPSSEEVHGDHDDFEILWSATYADLASKYGLDGVLMW